MKTKMNVNERKIKTDLSAGTSIGPMLSVSVRVPLMAAFGRNMLQPVHFSRSEGGTCPCQRIVFIVFIEQ